MTATQIPFSVETERILSVLTGQIYQSPLALLRENTQNAYDAILMRLARPDQHFEPKIEIDLSPQKLVVADNGIGMNRDVITQNFWRAGSSGKNNAEARAAGVVGTFGIGALANFGIAEDLSVETEYVHASERIVSSVHRSKLEINTNCIDVQSFSVTGKPGTTITATLQPQHQIDLVQAKEYLKQFVATLQIPVTLNGELLSQNPAESLVTQPSVYRREEFQNQALGTHLAASGELVFSQNGDVWVSLSELSMNNEPIRGIIILRSGVGNVRSFRNGFGLASAGFPSQFALGGVVDLLNLEPTAGREALTTESLQFLNSIAAPLDKFIAEKLSQGDECDSSRAFMNWVMATNRYELCGLLRMNIEPGTNLKLSEIQQRSKSSAMNAYAGNDPTIKSAYTDQNNPLLLFAAHDPRRSCEVNYLQKFCNVETVSNSPRVVSTKTYNQLSDSEAALKFRLESILGSDYYIEPKVEFGKLSHGLPMVVQQENELVKITLDSDAALLSAILGLHQKEPSALSAIARDFVRTHVYSKIAHFVPSSKRQGADAFLKSIIRKRELFEIESDELEAVDQIWADYRSGKISMERAIAASTAAPKKSVQTVSTGACRPVTAELADVVANERSLKEASPETYESGVSSDVAAPPILRLDQSSSAKLLTLEDDEPPFRGSRDFIALTDKCRSEYGEFFLEPHKTSCVWGGQRVLFIFLHHSGQYGIYYDFQTQVPVDVQPGGGAFSTATFVLKNKIFVPIPTVIARNFRPVEAERKRFDIRFDLLRVDGQEYAVEEVNS
ncbi:MAG: ATP-binding protein [Pseudomonadota bacterium]